METKLCGRPKEYECIYGDWDEKCRCPRECEFKYVKQNNMIYEVSGIVPKQYENEIAGGDSESLKDFTQKSKAFAFAKKESRKKKWWEVQVRFMEDGDIAGHWYFKNGKLTYDMAV